MLKVFLTSFVINWLSNLQLPIFPDAPACRNEIKNMSRWEPFDLVTHGSFEICSALIGEEIKYPNIVELSAHPRMESDTVERIAQDPALPCLRIKQGSSSEM